MIHPHTALRHINDFVGYGVFATQLIPQGTIVYVKDSLEIEVSLAEYQQHRPEMQEVIEKYSYIDEQGARIISWDLAKYVNHCCQCNTISTGYGFEIALRDIQAEEQITDEYGIFNLEQEMILQCSCTGCRGIIRPGDFEVYYPRWDKQIKEALQNFQQVEQPLFSLLNDETTQALDRYFHQPETYRSVYTLRYHQKSVLSNNGIAR